MGNLTISSATYAAQPQTKTGGAKQAGDSHLIADTTQTITFKRSEVPGTPDTIFYDTNITLSKHDTLYINIPVEKSDSIHISKEEMEHFEHVKKESHEIVSSMYKAIDGLGTDNKLFEEALSKINQDNILEVIDLWDKTAGKKYNESFIESFLGDANTEQRQYFGNYLICELHNRISRDGLDVSKYTKLMNTFLYLNSKKDFPPIGAIAATFNEILKQVKADYLQHIQHIKHIQHIYNA